MSSEANGIVAAAVLSGRAHGTRPHGTPSAAENGRQLKRLSAQLFQKSFAAVGQLFFQALCAIAVAAGPRFSAVFVPAIAPGMRVFDREQLEVLLPIRPFFVERGIAETCLHPMRFAFVIHARHLHITEIFIPGDGAAPEHALVNRLKKDRLLSSLQPCSNEVAHA